VCLLLVLPLAFAGCEKEVTISDGKIAEDEKWDGLKGYVTNTDLPAEEAVAQYRRS